MSRSMKKKGDELIVSEQDNTISSMIIFNELSVLINYPNKVLKSMKDIIVEENCGDKLKCIVDSIINNEPIDDVSKQIKLFKESLTDSHTENAEILIKCLTDSLIIKNNINEIAESLKKELNISSSEFNIDNFSSDKLFDNLQSCDKLKSSLPIIQCAVQKLRQFLASHVQWYINVLGKNGEIDTDMDALSSLQLYDSLKRIDPVRASALHPNDKRKITRSLEVWTLTGRRHSDILNEQRSQGSLLGGPLRFENTIIFWLTADKEVLNKRLDDRVYQMLGHGLVDELLAFHSEYHPNEGDFTRGIFQSIGFKEFRDFLMLSDEEKFGEVGKKKLNEGIETLKLVTQRYVKNQNKWIRNRFLKCPDRQVPPVYNLDTTDVEHWDDLVLEPAMDVIINTMEGKKSTKLKPLQQEKILTVDELTAMRTGEYYCDTCNRLFIGEQQWKEHISSGKHKKMLCKKRKSEDLQENIKIKSEEETEKYSKKFKFSEASTSVSVTDSDNEGPNLTNK
ncbi:tRNA dimethylallyltransferase [Lycorma delicatula]|uniref:tRNA dimethylallyltransferase n=1 Tax=Lycorma delicatula TaxID=130591 RepID=UPI003F516D7C